MCNPGWEPSHTFNSETERIRERERETGRGGNFANIKPGRYKKKATT